MSKSTANDDSTREIAQAFLRRALIVSDDDASALRDNLSSAGLIVERAILDEATHRVEELTPTVVLIAFGNRESEGRHISFARRLRSAPATFAIPVVFLYSKDGRTLRSAALHAGADDYFARDASREELMARLNSLLWRVEAGRRAAPTVADQRGEIDNFIFLLDAVGTDARRGRVGALALIETIRDSRASRIKDSDASRPENDAIALNETIDKRALAEAHGFLKLNLRRIDAVAFYGPATLLVYLPGADAHAARTTLTALCEEFSEMSRGGSLSVGISSFPAHGAEVEQLVEQAESALEKARDAKSRERLFVYGSESNISVNTWDTRRRTSGVADRDDSHAGSLETTSAAAGVGARATKERTVEEHGASNNRAASALQMGERRTGGKIRRLMLVVSEAARMAQVNLLMRSAGYEVRAAFDGQHALNLLRIDHPDLLVVDYELHGMDGVEMLKRLAKQSGASAPPALMLVPSSSEDIKRAAEDAGAVGLIQLPYDPVELLDTIGSLIEAY